MKVYTSEGYRDATEEEKLIRETQSKFEAFELKLQIYEVLNSKLQKDIKKDDVLGLLYISSPQPSTWTHYTYVGMLDNDCVHYVDNTLKSNGVDALKQFDIIKSFLVDSYHGSLWRYPKTEYFIIDGHHYEVIIILKDNKKIVYNSANAYFKAFDTLMLLIGLDARKDDEDDTYEEDEV
jgi:hypothetical protein